MMRLEQRAEALAMYERHGLRVIAIWGVKDGACQCSKGAACNAAGKHPLAPNWQDPENEYDVAAHTGNVGIAVSETYVVIDVDGHEGTALLAPFQPLPATWVAKTGRVDGGYHIYFKYKAGQEPFRNVVGNEKNGLLGIDLRAKGGQVLAWPSVHKSSGQYVWISSPDSRPCAELPDALYEALKAAQGKNDRARHEAMVAAEHVGTLEHIELGRSIVAKHPPAIDRAHGGPGDGNDITCALAVKLKIGCNLTEEAVLELMLPWNATCQPPWDIEGSQGLRRLIGNMSESAERPLGFEVTYALWNTAWANARRTP